MKRCRSPRRRRASPSSWHKTRHEVLGDPADGELLEPAVAADAVLVVNDRVALGDLAQVAQRGGLGDARLAQRARPEDLLLGDDDQVIGGQYEPAP